MDSLTNKREQEINRFIDENSVILPQHKLPVVSLAIDEIVKTIHSAGLNVDRVFLAGSMKKNTAVKVDWDVDLVVFFHCSFDDFENKQFRADYLTQIAIALKTSLRCEIKKIDSKHIVVGHRGVSFDVLGAFDATKLDADQVREQRINMRALVINRDDKLKFSASFTESSCEFVAKRGDESRERVTRAIRLCKLWNKTWFVKDDTHKTMLRSYAMELILCKIYDTLKDLSAPNLFLTMLYVLQLAGQKKLPENWETITFSDYFIYGTIPSSSRPLRVYDPCFPESDVVSEFDAWHDLADKAQRTIALLQSETPVWGILCLAK